MLKNIWVKKNYYTRGEQLKIATYNVRTLLKDEHVQELEEELKENSMKWDVIRLGEVRRKEESFTTLQRGHLLYHSGANNGKLEDKQIHQGGRQDASAWASEMKEETLL